MSDSPVGVAEAVKRAREIAAKMLPAAGISINGDGTRKRPLDDGESGPQVKKSSFEGASAQSIAQAALAKVGAQFGLISVEIKIPNRLVGLVIGRQGEMINKLQSDSGARIQVAPDGSEVNGLRSVSICGSPETVERAKVMVNGVVEDAGGATSLPTTVEPGQDVVEVMIPASKVGLVIGKGGEMIKTLQESAGCKMQMIQDGNFANAPEKPLRVTGSSENVKRARDLVLQLIEQKDMEARGHGMPQTTQINVPRALVGFVIGRNGEHINNIQSTCGVRLQFQNDVPGSEYRVATISGNPDACARAQSMVMDIVAEVSNRGNHGSSSAVKGQSDGRWGGHSQQYDQPPGGGFKPHIELPNPTGPGVTTVQFPIPAQKCGLIIGKGGETIRQLQVQCGAHIELHRGTHPNAHEKLFNIRGNPQEIAHAQQLLTEKIEGGATATGYPGQGYPGVAQMYPQGPYGQYPYQQAYAAAAGMPQPPPSQQPQQPNPQQPQQQQQQAQQAADPSHQAAWAAYYQQLYAAQAQAQGGQAQSAQQTGSAAPQSQPQSGQAGADLQAQWAEYYKSLGYAYYGQQGGAQGGAQPPATQGQPQPPAPPPVTSANGEQKAECPIPTLASELKEFLSSPERISVHSLQSAQRFWPCSSNDYNSLFKAVPSPLHSDLFLLRDSSSGLCHGYHEEELDEVGLTAKNSSSLNRSPAQPGLSVKGEPTNYPFWPGGFDTPAAEVFEKDSSFNTQNLLTQAPGLSNGMTFAASSIAKENDGLVSNVDLSEMLFGEGAIKNLMPPAEESKIVPSQQNDSIQPDDMIPHSHQQLEEVLTHAAVESSSGVAGKAVGEEKWAIAVDCGIPLDDVEYTAHKFPFILDPFQKHAISHLEKHENVFVAAHTSAGKTVVAEYAIALSRDHHTKVIYTSPIKALSNQKFREFRLKFGEESVGLITGDVQLKTEAPCLIMTTEILRSMLYNGSDVIRDVEWVIFDEVHYINDSERGVVWEEVLIMLPDHISIIMLSATVPNAMKFADWVGRTKKRKMFVITTPKRPVPLRHYLYTGNSKQTSNELFEIVSNKEIDKQSYNTAIRALKERSKKTATQFGPKTKHYVNPKQERSIWLSLIGALQKKEKLPIIAFTFSRNRCDGNADSLTTVDLLSTSSEKSEVHVYFEKAMLRLKGSDSKLPQISWMRDLLKRGIAVHHSGILPILKEVIELLFQRGLVRLLFATETFAMGVNMPARTVIFDSNRKHDGIQVRDLNPGEYIQMAGRAGRRGLDDDGTVILLCKADVPEMSDLKNMILGKPTSLESQFRLTYSMLLNLTRVETLKIKEMMRRSFAEIDSVQSQSKRIKELQKLEEEFASFSRQDDCPKCSPTITEYYHKCAHIRELQQKIQGIYFSSPQVMKSLQPGRIIVIYMSKYKYTAAVVLKNATQRLVVFLLCDNGDDGEDFNQRLVEQTEIELSQVQVFEHLRQLHFPGPPLCHAVITIPLNFVVDISDQSVKVDSSRIIDDYQKRQLSRFREDPPSSHCAVATQELSRFTETFSSGYDVSKTMKIKDIEFSAALQEKLKLESSMASYECIQCPNFTEHFSIVREKCSVEKKISDLKFTLSENSLQFLPEYKVRSSVLKRLSFVSEQGTIELKGRVACELHSQEVLVTELLFQNVLSGMEPAEIAALLSSVVFQQANCSEPNLCESLKKGKESILQVAQTIFELEKKCGLYDIVPEEDIASVLKFGLVEVVYEWARGKEFVEIIQLTDVSEGMIVRCIQRLDETCKDVRNAARVIGDSILYNKMQVASTLIKRDIVFAASLYIQ